MIELLGAQRDSLKSLSNIMSFKSSQMLMTTNLVQYPTLTMARTSLPKEHSLSLVFEAQFQHQRIRSDQMKKLVITSLWTPEKMVMMTSGHQ